MEAIVINLAGERERWRAMQSQFASLGLAPNRREAVPGPVLAASAVAALYSPALNRAQYHRGLQPGEIGCYASHIAAWRGLVGSAAPQLAVFEDDVRLHPELPRVLEAIARLPRGWDMIKLVGRRGREKTASQGPLLPGHVLVDYRRVPSLTAAYVVSQAGARKLLAHHPPFGRPVDVDLRHWWECGIEVLGVLPYPVSRAPLGERSSIDGRYGGADAQMRWRKLRLQLAYTLQNRRCCRERAQQVSVEPAWALPGKP